MQFQNSRLHALDNLRAILALLGIPFHVIFLLFVYVALSSGHALLDPNHFLLEPVPKTYHWAFLIIFYLHAFRMPAFFLLAGFFAHMLYKKSGAKHFFKNRVLRIGIPFLFFMAWIVPSYLETTFFVALHQKVSFENLLVTNYQSGVMWHVLNDARSYWFLYDLLWFYFLTGVVLLLNRYVFYYEEIRSGLRKYFKKTFLSFHLYWLVPIICSILLLAGHYWYAILDESLLPSFSLLAFYSLWYFIGWGFWLHKARFNAVIRRPWMKLLLSILFYALYLNLYLHYVDANNILIYALAIFCYAIAMTFGVLAIIGVAWGYLPRYQAFLSYISQAGYWIYLIQVPILLYLVPIIMALTPSFAMRLIYSTLICIFLCVASFHWFGRYVWLGYLLGIKVQKRE